MSTKIYANAVFGFREDTLENWTSNNPVLRKGEPAVVRDGENGQWLKIGDGITSFNNLPWKTGPKGDMGEQGPKGEKGEKGEKGDTGEAGKDAITDQTYNPESENAQSGKAVAEAVSGKADVEQWELIETVTLAEEVSQAMLVYEKLKKAKIYITIPSGGTGNFNFTVMSDKSKYTVAYVLLTGTSAYCEIWFEHGKLHMATDSKLSEYSQHHSFAKPVDGDATRYIRVDRPGSATGVNGTIFEIWGVRA